MELGQKLRNPYSISNMKNAYWSWRQKFRMGDGSFPTGEEIEQIIVSTNTYYRVLPADEAAYDLLKDDTTKEFFDFPLDYEMSGGNNYHDPSLPDTVLSWQYTVVPNDELGSQRMTGENIDIITNDIFLPENSPYYNDYDSTFWNAIENEALILAGYPEEAAVANVYKSGIIKIHENITSNNAGEIKRDVPLEGAKIVGRNFWRNAHGFTDINGFFTLNKNLRGAITYFIKWERPGKYDIRSGWYWQAWSFIGKKPTTSIWEHTIISDVNDGFDYFYGSLHRGAYDFFYHDPWGFSKPSARIKIGAMKGENPDALGINLHFSSLIAGPDIRVWRLYDGLNRKSIEYYSTMVHELGHSSQRSLGVNRHVFCSKLFRESYARMIQWLLCTYKFFPNELNSEANIENNVYSLTTCNYIIRINALNNSSIPYTPLFLDLIDVDDNNTVFGLPINDFMIEHLSFNPLIIENYFKIRGWNLNTQDNLIELREFLKAQPNTDATVDAEIDHYINTYYLPYNFE